MALFPFGKKDSFEKLRQRNWSSREELQDILDEVLGSNGSKDLDQIVSMIFMPESLIRRAALRRAREIGDPAIVDSFMKQARQHPPNILPGLTRSLVKVLPRSGMDRALKYLEHRDEGMRRLAEIFALCGPITGKVLELARTWLAPNGDPRRALQVMDTLIRANQGGEGDQRVLSQFAELAIAFPDEKVRNRGWRVLIAQQDPGNLKAFVEGMSKESYSNQKILADAIVSLIQNPNTDSNSALLPLLSSTNSVLRTTAVNILKRLDDMEDIVRAFTRSAREMPPLTRERAFETLRDLGERVLPALIDLMEDDDAEIRNLVVTMASTVGTDPRMVPPLVKALKESSWWIRATVAETLGQIGTPEVIPPLIEQLKDEDTVWTAIGALANTARVRKRSGDKRGHSAAMQPLLSILKKGQQSTPGPAEAKKDDVSADLRLEVLQALRQDGDVLYLDLLKRVASNDKHPNVRREAFTAVNSIARRAGQAVDDVEELKDSVRSAITGAEFTDLEKLLAEARQLNASDLHIASEQPLMFRRAGQLRVLREGTVSPETAKKYIRELLSDEQAQLVAKRGQVSFCHTVEGNGRFRANVFADYRGVSAVFRVVPEELPTLQTIGLPSQFSEVQYWHQGLLLVCGASGSGKTTTLAALINLINETRESHILTIEDPIEYIHPSRRSLVNQRELISHTRSYHRALRGALREDPDVIVIGELSDAETVAMALEASETGHLVIGTLNCTTAVSAIERVIGSFSVDEQNQVRLALSESCKAIIAQALVPTVDNDVTAIFEVLMGGSTVGNIIRENKLLMLESLMQTGRAQGHQTADDALLDLVRARRVSVDTAIRRARTQNAIDELSSMADQEGGQAAPPENQASA